MESITFSFEDIDFWEFFDGSLDAIPNHFVYNFLGLAAIVVASILHCVNNNLLMEKTLIFFSKSTFSLTVVI